MAATKPAPIKLKRTIAAPLAEVYRALTHPTALRDWLADAAQSEPRPGGRLYLWWNDGYYANGRFAALEPGKKVAFSWHGSGEPRSTSKFGPRRVNWASKGCSIGCRENSLGVSGNAWLWAVRWCGDPRCRCWTNRCRISTPRCGASCGAI